MISATFVIPTWHYWLNPYKLQPLWELYYAEQIRHAFPENEVAVRMQDLRGFRGKDFQEIVTDIPEQDVYFYWIMKSGDSVEVKSIADLLKKKYPNSKHVAGGTHVDMCIDECKNQFDAIMVGPGEQSLKQIINDLKANNLKNVYQMSYSQVPFTDTPFARRDTLLPRDAVVNNVLFEQYGGVPGTSIYFSRGCVYSCSYCVYNVPATIQVRSREMIRNELEYLKKTYQIGAVNLRDEVAIHPNKKVSQIIYEELGAANLIWRGQTTVQAGWDELKLARESGCQELSIGVETVDDKVMEIINKRQSEKQIRDFIENAKKLGIKIKMCLIFGLPGEPMDIVDRTIKFISETNPDFVSLSGFCPIPGSPIFKNSDFYGIKSIDRDWSKHAHLLYRFSNEEEVGLPFEYKPETQWGKSFSRKEIMTNIQTTQRWLESREMTY